MGSWKRTDFDKQAVCDNCGRVYTCKRRRNPGYCKASCRMQVHRNGKLDLFEQAKREEVEQ